MSPKTCPICQTAIPENAPGGFCPVCLLRGAGAPCLTGREAPPIEEIAAAFPQLEILELIGQGGMGFVYKARQSHLDRTVALKILAPELQRDPSFAERFAREARALGKLRHPNIVTLHEHGENGGFFYLLMEYVDGVNLRQAMAAGRFTPEQALAVVPPICDALQSAHAQGVWHRDIKPENILLDRDGRVKIADFGIARIASDPVCNFTLTFTGHTLGSAAYMAPEQHENPRHVDHRADIYSLGVVIYEMLTGELPLGRFPAPSQRAEVNARIDEIVLRTLEKERELRQQSADEVKTDVTSISSHASPPQRKNVPLASPASGKRLGAKTIFFLCAGSLALGCAAFFLQAMLSKRPEERLQDSPPLADHGTKEQPAAVSTANDWKIDTEKLVTPEREGWAPWQTHIKEGNMRALQRDWSGASASYLEGLAVAQKKAETVPGWQANVAESYRYVGDAMCAMSDLKGALRNYQAGVAIYEKLLEKTPADSQLRDHLIEIHVRAGDVLKAAGDAAGALQSYRDGVAASEKLKKGWETEYPLGRREDALARNYQAAEVLRLIDTPNREPGDLMWMIGQAGAEKDDRLRPLLARKNLREDSTLALSLAGYDYSLNGNQNGLDFILANLSKQQVGADVNEVFVLAFLDEWDRSIKAVNSHFLLLDGAGGDCKNMFWARRMLLFPRNYLVYKGKAGDGAPLPASKAVLENAKDTQQAAGKPDDESDIRMAVPKTVWDPGQSVVPDPSKIDGTNTWNPWAEQLKNGDMLRMKGDAPGALASYRASLATAELNLKRSPNQDDSPRNIALSRLRIGDMECLLGNLAAALEHYQSALAGFWKLDPRSRHNDERTKWMRETEIRIGDIYRARGDKGSALLHYRSAVAASMNLTFQQWEETMKDQSPSNYTPAEPFDPAELHRLAREWAEGATERDREYRLTWLTLRAGAEKNASFRHLLEREDLKKAEEIGDALASYDYSINENTDALNYLLAKLAAEKVGSDSGVVVALGYLDDWDHSIKAVDAHFTATDGAGSSCKRGFWTDRMWLFPRHYLEHYGNAGDGAPIPQTRTNATPETPGGRYGKTP